MTTWLHTATSDLFNSFYGGSSDGMVQSEISEVTKMDSVFALMLPEKDMFGFVTEMFEVFVDVDNTGGTLLVTEVAPFTCTDYVTNGELFHA